MTFKNCTHQKSYLRYVIYMVVKHNFYQLIYMQIIATQKKSKYRNVKSNEFNRKSVGVNN